MNDEEKRQALIEYFAAYPGTEVMSNKWIAKACLCQDMRVLNNREIDGNPELSRRIRDAEKLVAAFKKELAMEQEQLTLWQPLTTAITNLRSIPRCALCGTPLADAATCEVSELAPFGFMATHTLHRACIEGYHENLRWKVDLLHKMIGQRQARA